MRNAEEGFDGVHSAIMNLRLIVFTRDKLDTASVTFEGTAGPSDIKEGTIRGQPQGSISSNSDDRDWVIFRIDDDIVGVVFRRCDEFLERGSLGLLEDDSFLVRTIRLFATMKSIDSGTKELASGWNCCDYFESSTDVRKIFRQSVWGVVVLEVHSGGGTVLLMLLMTAVHVTRSANKGVEASAEAESSSIIEEDIRWVVGPDVAANDVDTVVSVVVKGRHFITLWG